MTSGAAGEPAAAPAGNVRFGLVLPNRGVVLGLTSMGEMLDMVERAEENPAWDSVWAGDSILAKPRLDALVLLGGIATMTSRVKLGVACLASAPQRQPLILAYQWASLDFMSGGRSIFVACQGQPGTGGGQFREEFAALGIDPAERMGRMEEAIEILRLTTSREHVSYEGTYNRFEDVTILPRPIQQPVPIWVTANPRSDNPEFAERALRRVARMGDGWMTTATARGSFGGNLAAIRRYAEEEGRALPADFEACLYYNVIVDEDRERGLADAKRYLDQYYGADYAPAFIERWVAAGSVAECIGQIGAFIEAGATTIALRVVGHDQDRQFRRVSEEVLPALLATPGGRNDG